jgi:ABC-type spermidine/putrescine transport systems, ATPase components
MPFIELRDVCKSFGKTEVVKDLSLEVHKGEFLSFLGGSGCGKTTTLRMIAGFEEASSGSIFIDGRDMANVPPRKRRLGMVFQNYALFPNMDVAGNIAFGLKVAGVKGDAARSRIAEMLSLIGMEGYGHRYPRELSGGQQQRVALARAIAARPEALLLDEPLSALDAKIRQKLREDIRSIQKKLGMTMLYVTHDQEEALSISDRVAVMCAGRIEQLGSPSEIYDSPATPFVASFIGSLSVLPAQIIDPEAGLVLFDGRILRAGFLDAREWGDGAPIKEGDPCSLSLRPEAISLSPASAADNVIPAQVEAVKFLGSIVRLVVWSGGARLFVDSFNDPLRSLPQAGDRVELCFPPAACRLRRAKSCEPLDPLPAEKVETLLRP